MIYIKDKGNRTQIFIPRNGKVAVDYATEVDILEINERLNAIVENYATKEYVDDVVGYINNELEEILG